MNGIYTLANDYVYDQLVALLNSIERNVGTHIPVAVIAYDDRVERVRELVAGRTNVSLLDDDELFAPWESFSYEAWKGHPTALSMWSQQGISGVNRIGMNRRYAAFDPKAPFDRFLYFDADVLLLGPVDYLFAQLEQSPFIVYDFQYKDPTHIYNVASPKLNKIFPQEKIQTEIFCAGFYGGVRGLFTTQERHWLSQRLNEGEGEVLYTSAPNQSLLNYMKMRLSIPVYNFALELAPEKTTGCSVTSPHFLEKDRILYDKGERLTYLHYIGVPSKFVNRLCAGENIDFPYRDLFLHYRYLHNPEDKVTFTGRAKAYNAPPPLHKRVMSRLGL